MLNKTGGGKTLIGRFKSGRDQYALTMIAKSSIITIKIFVSKITHLPTEVNLSSEVAASGLTSILNYTYF